MVELSHCGAVVVSETGYASEPSKTWVLILIPLLMYSEKLS